MTVPVRPKLLVFDVGETLASEERIWSGWADWLAVPSSTFFAVLGAVIAERRSHEEVFERLRPGLDVAAERRARIAAGQATGFQPADLFPDTAKALAWARREGFRLGFAGNNATATESFLRTLAQAGDL